jgi:3-oxoacyl-[acyl-carrier-protein] synthase III
MRITDVFIAGLGSCLPESFPAARAVELGLYSQEEYDSSGWTGAAVAGDLPAPDMAVRAASQALARSGHSQSEVGLLLHASFLHQGPDGWSAHHYIQRHTIGHCVPAFEIRQTCSGMLGAVELACCYLTASDRHPAALVTGADNFGTSLVDRWQYSAGVTASRRTILGDAGSAILLSRRAGFARLRAIASASLPDLEEMYRGDLPLFPPTCTTGEPMRLGERMAEFERGNPAAFADAKKQLQEARTDLARQVLDEAGVSPSDITRATHVFGGKEEYVRSVLAPLGIDASRGVLEFGRRLGHLSVNDQIVGLTHLVETAAVGPGDHVLMLSVGGGMALSCAVVEIIERVGW